MREHEPLRPGDPRTLGEYRLTGRLGEGAQGVLYRGRAPDGGPAAVRLLPLRFGPGSPARDHFARELLAVRRIDPFCTARVLAADIDGDLPYLAVEFVDGLSLADVVGRHGPRSGPEPRGLAGAMAGALSAVHRAGAVHGDLRPGNVLLSREGPRVVDFGLARVLAALSPLPPAAGRAYQAPERLSGGVPDAAADVFAWAATVVYAACGRPPAGPFDTGGLDGPLNALVLECLAPDPRRRPPAADIVHRLQDAAAAPALTWSPAPSPLPAPPMPPAASHRPPAVTGSAPGPSAPVGRSPADVPAAPVPGGAARAPGSAPGPGAATADGPGWEVRVAASLTPEGFVNVDGSGNTAALRRAAAQISAAEAARPAEPARARAEAARPVDPARARADAARPVDWPAPAGDVVVAGRRDEPDRADTGGFEVRFESRAPGARREAARRRMRRRNAIMAGAVAACLAVTAGGYLLWSAIGPGPDGTASRGAALPGTGRTVEVATTDGSGYRLGAVTGGTDGDPAPTVQSSPPADTAHAYIEYVLTNARQRPILLEFPADLFVRRARIPEKDRGRCMWQPGVPEDMCTPPTQSRVVRPLGGAKPPARRDGDLYLEAGASYLVRVTTEVPVDRGLTRKDMKLYVWKHMFMSDQLAEEIPFAD